MLDRLNIQQKIMACFSLAFLCCLALLRIVLGRMVTEQALEQAQEAACRQIRQTDASLVSMERLLKSEFLQLSKNGEVRQGSGLTVYAGREGNENGILQMNPEAAGGFELRAYQIFQQFAKRHENIIAAVTYGMQDGGYVQYPAVTRENNYDPRQLYWYRDGMAAGESGLLYVSPPFQGAHGKPVIGFYSLVWNTDEEPAGILGLQLDLAALLDMTLPEEAEDKGRWMVLDAEDSILIDPKHPDAVFRKLADANLGDISLLGQKKEGISRILLDDEELYAVISTSEATKLKYIRLLDADEVMAGTRKVRLALAALLLLSLAISFFGSRWLAAKITAPFRAMEEKAEAIGAGRLRGAEGLAESDDEVGRLTLAFQEMAGELREKLQGVKDGAVDLAEISGRLAESIANCRRTAAELSEKTQGLTAAEETQAKTVSEVAGQLDGLAESLGRASDGMKEIGKVTHRLGRTASDGRQGLQKAAQELSEARKRADSAVSVAATLDKKAVQASDLVKSIGEMAEQLNLLALNAAVESARAAGNSKDRNKFTAVAEEVRQLSEQSSKAARKTALVISALQQEAQQAATAVKETETAIASGKDSLRERDSEFQQLESQLEQIEKILAQASAAIQALDGSGKRIQAAAEQVEWGARKSADAAEAVSKAAQEQSQSLVALEDMSKSLSGTAETLQARASSFEL